MTNHWRDIRHADVIIINGANPAEAHPVGFQWFLKAKLDPQRGIGSGGGAKMIHIDPRFTRTSAVSDVYARIRTGTDTAFFGGLINYVLEKNLIHHEYVRNYTNASFLVKEGFGFDEGLFSGYDPVKRIYDTSTWAYEGDAPAQAAFERTQKEIARPRPGPGRRRGGGGAGQARHAARASALGVPAPAQALLALHAGDGRLDHRHSRRAVPGDRQDRRRDRPSRQGDDGRLRGRAHAPHHRRPAHPHRRHPAAPARQHGAAGRRHERRARSRQHPGQHRQRDLVGDPARLSAHPGAGAEEPRRLRDPERAQEVRRELLELLRHQLPEVHGQPAQGLVRRRGDEGQRVRLRLHPQAGDELVVDLDLRPGAQEEDGGRHPVGDDRDQHRSRRQPGDAGAGQPQVAGGDGPAADDQLGVLAAAGRGSEVDPDRGLHDPDHALDREGRLVREQRPLDAVEGGGRSARGRPPRPLDPGRGVPAREEAVRAAGRQVPGAGDGARR